jgi:hypothetical protein
MAITILSSLLVPELASDPATPPSDQLALYGNTSGALKTKNDAGTVTTITGTNGADAQPTSTFVTTGDTTSNVTTLADVTGASFALAANTTYQFRIFCRCQSTATTNGLRVVLNVGSLTFLAYTTTTPTSGTAATIQHINTSDGGATTTAAPSANGDFLVMVEGVVRCSASATLQLRLASELTTQTAKVMSGTVGMLWQM